MGTTLVINTRAVVHETAAILKYTTTLLNEREVTTGITIDASNSKVLDDAFSLERTVDDGYMLHISIADVGGAIPLHLAPLVDREAYKRAYTQFCDQIAHHVLPQQLAEHALSLVEGEARPALTISIPLDRQLCPGEPRILPTAFTNQKRLSYEDVDGEIHCPRTAFGPMLQDAFVVATGLLERRRRLGALAYFDPRGGWSTTEEGSFFQLHTGRPYKAQLIVGEMMILLNQVLALYCARRDLPILYRNHAAKAIAPERSMLLALIDALGSTDKKVSITARGTVNLALEHAFYSPTIAGHFGLNTSVYTHLTSPLRRYADLVNQRILHAHLAGEPSPYSQTDLVRISTRINQVEASLGEGEASILEKCAQGDGMAEIPTAFPGSLEQLTGRQFHRLLRVAAQEGRLPEALDREIRRRLADHQLSPNDLYTLIFRSPYIEDVWEDLRKETFLWLREHAYMAVNILGIGQQNHRWGQPSYELYEGQFDRRPFFRGKAWVPLLDKRRITSSWQAASKKSAVTHALCVELVEKIAGFSHLVGPLYDDVPFDALQAGECDALTGGCFRPIPLKDHISFNAKGRLQELVQASRDTLPHYTLVGQTGPEHAPVFIAEVTMRYQGQTYSAQGRDLKRVGAEQQAAAAVVRLLSQSGSGGVGESEVQSQRFFATSA